MNRVALALDTCTPYLSAALVREESGVTRTLATRMHAPPAIVSTLVPGVFDELLTEAHLTLADVDVFVAGTGPGLFTGVRVAVGTMKALAYARKKPLIGAGSLESMALGVASSEVMCPALDARKGEVYWALYRMDGSALVELSAPAASPPAALAEKLIALDRPVNAFGTGAGMLPQRFVLANGPLVPDAAAIATLALLRNPDAAYDPTRILAFEPNYLRPPEAEVARKKRAALG